MSFLKEKLFINIFAVGLCLTSFQFSPSVKSASALAAWLISNDGILRLRTSNEAKLKAYFQSSGDGKGERVWIDFQGELSRPRTLSGNGPIKEIRLGKPTKGITRLVIEFNQYVDLKPNLMKLKGIAPDRWELKLEGLPTRYLKQIGEGNVQRKTKISSSNKKTTSNLTYQNLKLSDLPDVPKDYFLIVIDPGHGGPDSGAIGIGGLRESEIVLDVSKQVASLLSRKGVKVRLTRSSEIDLDLPPRVDMANRIKADAFVSIHANASRGFQKHVNGLETYYFSGSRALRLAENIQEEILKAAPLSPDRGVRQGRFFVIRRTRMPAALVEIGFVTGRDDSINLASKDHRTKMAFAISKGILHYLKGAKY